MWNSRTGWVIGAALVSAALTVSPAGGQRATIQGTIAGVEGPALALEDGARLIVAEDARVTLSREGTPADLEPGQFVAVTAVRAPDGTLEASLVSVFPPSSQVRPGQFPLSGENLMTNANIEEAVLDRVDEAALTVSFEGQTDRVRLGPLTRVVVRTDGSREDLVPGAVVSATVTDGVASSLTVVQ